MLAAEGVEVGLDFVALERITSNLVANAREATGESGRITLTTARDRAANELVLAVSDDGGGLDPSLASRIFEPYFSTKGERGRGLGLATVHGLVRAAKGHVSVESELGRGATFRVRLPIV